ncbi:hypothetical protein ACJWDR_29175 [Streptomyces tauricus]|uniref:hypothetical protein n=1 Tax=Streptomyces tauricus TaxID=68274 RepID=UPI00387F01BE
MTGAERRALLGDAVVADIHARVAQSTGPVPEEVIDTLRRILAPAMARVLARKAPAPAAEAA